MQAAQILGVTPSTIETYRNASKGSQISAAILARLECNVLGRIVRFAQAAGHELSNRGEQVTDVYTIDFQALHEPHVPLGVPAPTALALLDDRGGVAPRSRAVAILIHSRMRKARSEMSEANRSSAAAFKRRAKAVHPMTDHLSEIER